MQAPQIASILMTVAVICQAQINTVAHAPASAAATSPAPLNASAKKLGVLRIGIAQPSIQLGAGMPPFGYSESVRQLFVNYLKGPAVEVFALTSTVPEQIDVEASHQGCEYILYSGLLQKQGGGFGLLKGASSLVSLVPMGGLLRGVATAASTANAASAMANSTGMSSMIKARSQVSLSYKLVQIGSATAAIANTLQAKATTDGQDIIAPLVMQAATDIVEHAPPKR